MSAIGKVYANPSEVTAVGRAKHSAHTGVRRVATDYANIGSDGATTQWNRLLILVQIADYLATVDISNAY